MIDIKEKYQIIYADPPWKYGGSGGTKWYRADNYYPTMTFDELKASFTANEFLYGIISSLSP